LSGRFPVCSLQNWKGAQAAEKKLKPPHQREYLLFLRYECFFETCRLCVAQQIPQRTEHPFQYAAVVGGDAMWL
jgi:hypothetical protein